MNCYTPNPEKEEKSIFEKVPMFKGQPWLKIQPMFNVYSPSFVYEMFSFFLDVF